jgi:hypothetical protein
MAKYISPKKLVHRKFAREFGSGEKSPALAIVNRSFGSAKDGLKRPFVDKVERAGSVE